MFDNLYEPAVISVCPDWAALYKPPGRETVSLDGGPDLLSEARRLLEDDGLTPVHRLDRDTTGVQLFARNRRTEEELSGLFRRRQTDKLYLALCLGVPRNASGTINRNLSEWEGGRRPVRVVKRGGLEASTAYRVAAASPGGDGTPAMSLVAFSPHQGRTHQIRVHAAALGYPILGDDQYGDRSANKIVKDRFGLARQALHARRLSFPWRGGEATVACPLAEDMRLVAAGVFGRGDF